MQLVVRDARLDFYDIYRDSAAGGGGAVGCDSISYTACGGTGPASPVPGPIPATQPPTPRTPPDTPGAEDKERRLETLKCLRDTNHDTDPPVQWEPKRR